MLIIYIHHNFSLSLLSSGINIKFLRTTGDAKKKKAEVENRDKFIVPTAHQSCITFHKAGLYEGICTW